jgi:hypothetical protein
VLGFWFGFLLERAGFGSPRKLASIFYFKDFAVLKVMFTAIVVAMLLILYCSLFGWLDIEAIYVLPTYIWPYVIGGLLLGVGFVMGGYCPTTSLVAAVSGRLDGLVFIIGMMIGVVLFAEMFPLLEGIYTAGYLGQIRLPEILHLSSGTIAFAVCIMAAGAFWLGEKAEKKFAGSPPPENPSRSFKWTGAVILVSLGFLLMIVGPDKAVEQEQATVSTAPVPTEKVTPPQPGAADIPQEGVVFGDDEGC